MSFRNPFTAKHDPNLSTQEITETMTEPTLPTYDPEIHTLIDGVVAEIDTVGGRRLTNGKTIIDTIKYTEYLRTADRYAAQSGNINAANRNFRNFLRALWESGLDQDALNTVFEEHNLPTARKKWTFSAKVEIDVYGVVGYGATAEEAWESVESGAFEEALNDGNYNTYSMSDPYSYDEAEEDEDDSEDPEFNDADIFDLT